MYQGVSASSRGQVRGARTLSIDDPARDPEPDAPRAAGSARDSFDHAAVTSVGGFSERGLSLGVMPALAHVLVAGLLLAVPPHGRSSQEEPTRGVHGTVVDTTGLPASDVEITAFPRPPRPFPRWGNVAGEEVRVRTDASGRFELPPAALGYKGQFQLYLRKPGHGLVAWSAWPRFEPTELEPLVLGPGRSLTVVVQDEAGEPVPRAQVQLEDGVLFSPSDRFVRPGEQGRFVIGLTDERGRLTIPDFPLERTTLLVAADGRVIVVRTIAPAMEELVVTTRAGASIEGRVVPAPETPDAFVVYAFCFDPFAGPRETDPLFARFSAAVRPDGSFHLGGMTSRTRARLAVHDRTGALRSEPRLVDPGQVGVELWLRPPAGNR